MSVFVNHSKRFSTTYMTYLHLRMLLFVRRVWRYQRGDQNP